MGKRKDRILAAISNAGRRVKLDLSVEPSGDLGGSSVHDDVGKDTESKESAGLPNSPSSSGQQQQNPLQLLGQYSDGEMDEESNERFKQAVAENSSNENENMVKGPCCERSEDKDVNAGDDLMAQEVRRHHEEGYVISLHDLKKPEVIGSTESDTASVHLPTEINLSGQTSAAGSSATQVIGDVSSGWKIVLHEESNQYYYWNIETRETSWEVPQALAQTTELTVDQRTTIIENTQSTAMASNESNSIMGVVSDYYSTAPVDGSMDTNMISQSKDVYECAAQINEMVEGSKGEALKDENGTAVSQIELSSTGGTADAFSGDGSLVSSGMYIQGSMSNEQKATVSDLSSSLVKRSEELLQKLKSLEGSKGRLQGHDWTSKYVLEVEIRVSDFKSLVAYGSSLLPFWLHSERQLKRLEDSIDGEIYQIAKSQVDEVMATYISAGKVEDKSVEIRQECQVDQNQNDTILSTSVISKISPNTDKLTGVKKDLCKEDSFTIVVHAENNAASGSVTRHSESGSIDGEQINGTVLPDQSVSKPEYHADEDVDMDVDMEVEDPFAAENTYMWDTLGAKNFAPKEQPVLLNQPADHPSLPSEDAVAILSPPDDEWVPPPPPDNELVPPPPPPPDEPPEPSYPPTISYMENVQPFPYTDQYNLPYPDSSFAYYGHTVTEIRSNFYGHADGSQVDVSHTSIYYGAVPSTYDGTASVMVNPAASVAYYRLQDGSIPSVPVASGIESSQNHIQSGQGVDTTTASDQVGFIDTLSEAGTAVKDNVSAAGGGTEMGSLGVPSTSATIQALATVSEKESIPSLSTNAVTSSATTATSSSTAKVQSKTGRNKKRTVAVAVAPSLRSNKKVSSLVDKWKAAKEELNENEEDEPENAYEIFERKRQREIEEWHAQQIASGEAKDNANFQPLGGDWREKVKHRRAQKAKEAALTPSEALTDGNQQQQQPDLADMSRYLPSGWQAYWDENSKLVYYGNTITSETTWTRPTK